VTGTTPIDSLRRLRKDSVVPAAVAVEGRFTSNLLRAIDWMMRIDEAERPASVAALRAALGEGDVAEQTARSAIESVNIVGAIGGRIRFDFSEPIRSDILEVAVFVEPPGSYATISESGGLGWSCQPHYCAG
jgi:hypothetical protein